MASREAGALAAYPRCVRSSPRAFTVVDAWQRAYTFLYSNLYQEAVMQPLRLDEDIRPLSEFRAGVAGFVRRVSETRRPLLLTQHGRGVAVLVDVREFEAMRERLALLEDVNAAEADIAAGRVTPHDEARARLLEELGT
jgi:prevent-host-death family protein